MHSSETVMTKSTVFNPCKFNRHDQDQATNRNGEGLFLVTIVLFLYKKGSPRALLGHIVLSCVPMMKLKTAMFANRRLLLALLLPFTPAF